MFIKDIVQKSNNVLIKHITLVLVLFVILFIIIGIKSGNCVDNGDLKPKKYENRVTASSAPMMAVADMAYSESNAVMAKSVARSPVANTGGNNKKIIKNYSLTVEVKNIKNSNEKIDESVKKFDGYVENFYSYGYGNDLAYSYTLRINSKNLDEAVKFFKSLGVLKSENSSTRDVTEQYVDNENRLKNLTARRDRLRKMMDTKTDKLADILAVDKELSEVQYQIENFEKRNTTIDKDVTYSQVSLTLTPELKVEEFSGSKWKISTSWNNSINKLVNFSRSAVDYAFTTIVFLPILLLILLLIFVIKKLIVKIKKV